MKKYNLIFLIIFFLFSSCEEEIVDTPDASFNMSAEEVSINETVEFEYTGTNAKQIVVYTGDTDHDYELKTQSNTGFVMNKGRLTYAYKKPGTYKVVVVATNYNKDGSEIIFNTVEKTIVVIDDRTDLRQISLKKDLYNKELPAIVLDNILFFTVPYKVRINNRDIAVSASAQRLEIVAYSESASILINEEDFVATTRYDLTQPLALAVVSDAGDTKNYVVETLRLPVFESFSINGVSGSIIYSDYHFDKMYISITLPAGTNRAALVPEFASVDAKSIKIDETEQTSGNSTVDFSSPVIYRLINWKDGLENKINCETEIEVTVIIG